MKVWVIRWATSLDVETSEADAIAPQFSEVWADDPYHDLRMANLKREVLDEVREEMNDEDGELSDATTEWSETPLRRYGGTEERTYTLLSTAHPACEVYAYVAEQRVEVVR